VEVQDKKSRLEVFERLCREQGLPLTLQRRLVLESFLDLDDHPTADQIHAAVACRSPEVSRTTVYRTLETLDRMGVITKLCHPGRVVRYDRRTDLHHHLVCLRCDQVMDFADAGLDGLPVPDTSAQGFEVRDCRVQLRGICSRCRDTEEPS